MVEMVSSPAHRFLCQELDPAWMSVVIILYFFISGLVDSNAFASWSCFVGMQTGNTIFAALGITHQPRASHDQQWYKSIVSIAAFCAGTLFFNLLHRWPSGIEKAPLSRARWIFVLSTFAQAVFILGSAVLVTLDVVSDQPFIAGKFSSGSTPDATETSPTVINYLDLLPIVLLAFQSAGQVCLSRVLEIIELPTIVLSTLFHDFTGDVWGTLEAWRKSTSLRDFITVQYKRQEKRLLAILAFFLGALVGGQVYKSSIGMGGTLWVAAGLKGIVTIGFLLWSRDPAEKEGQTLSR